MHAHIRFHMYAYCNLLSKLSLIKMRYAYHERVMHSSSIYYIYIYYMPNAMAAAS